MIDHKGYYALLNCDVNSSQDAIKKQYKSKVMLYHPDKTHGDVEKENMFKQIQAAYETLSDEHKRSMYDMNMDGQDIQSGVFDEDVTTVFMNLNDLFGGIFPNSDNVKKTHSQHDSMHEICVELSLSEVLNGCTRTEPINMPTTCLQCGGCGYTYDSVINCLRCGGNGFLNSPVIPFPLVCDSCMGSAHIYKNKRVCTCCEGDGMTQEEKMTEFDIPAGTQNNTQFEIESTSLNNPLILIRVKHAFHNERYECRVKDNNLLLKIKLNIKELLCGFCKNIEYGNSKVKVKSNGYFDISKHTKIKGKGVTGNTPEECGDMYLKFELEKSDYDKQLSDSATLVASIFT